MAELLLEDMRRSLDALRRRPPSRKLTAQEGGGFSHDAVAKVPAAGTAHGRG